LLLVVPISLVAARLGWRGGVAAAVASMALVVAWDNARDVGLAPLGYIVRAVVFFWIAGSLGVLSSQGPGGGGNLRSNRLLTDRPPNVVGASGLDSVSPRELEVLELIARGATNVQIAAHFVISETTVKSHVKHILHKLGVGNRTEAAMRYVELNGHPPSEYGRRSTDAPGTSGSLQLVAKSERRAEVVGFPASDRALLRLDGGRTIEVPLPETIRDRGLDKGTPALVYFNQNGAIVGWYVPEAGLGVNMRTDRERGR
jgi:DNA-binding CsgD family transcriptional regulator